MSYSRTVVCPLKKCRIPVFKEKQQDEDKAVMTHHPPVLLFGKKKQSPISDPIVLKINHFAKDCQNMKKLSSQFLHNFPKFSVTSLHSTSPLLHIYYHKWHRDVVTTVIFKAQKPAWLTFIVQKCRKQLIIWRASKLINQLIRPIKNKLSKLKWYHWIKYSQKKKRCVEEINLYLSNRLFRDIKEIW